MDYIEKHSLIQEKISENNKKKDRAGKSLIIITLVVAGLLVASWFTFPESVGWILSAVMWSTVLVYFVRQKYLDKVDEKLWAKLLIEEYIA